MVLSVIIVNYRVRYFLELCLRSVQKALSGLEAEIIVVDNHSADGTMDLLRPLFPEVSWIVNTENRGFARANNQGLERAKGKYVLFLNPDTVLPEDFMHHCLSFLERTPGVGGVGVRMIDGSGRFLKESRRGFPSPWVSFCKLSGLTALFPKSRLFSQYYLSYLPPDTTHPASVLSGACLWVARAIVMEAGGFDEQFFMYAEDIDLSYRLEKAGYVNYYLADTTIVHFKGESTRKDIRYVRQFYKAMSQFRNKHFHKELPVLLNIAVEMAIWCRAGIGAIGRAFSRSFDRTGGKRTGGSGKAGIETAGRDKASRGAARRVIRTWLTGDATEISRVSELLTLSGKRMIVTEEQQADEVIFCEGRDHSFRQSIQRLAADAPYRHGRQVKFHASGSRSATGSAGAAGRGETLVF